MSVPSSLSIRIIQIPGTTEWYSHGATFPLCGTATEVLSPCESLPRDFFYYDGQYLQHGPDTSQRSKARVFFPIQA